MAGMVAAAVAGADHPHIHPAPPFPIPPPSLIILFYNFIVRLFCILLYILYILY
jgi:hypothetical protein